MSQTAVDEQIHPCHIKLFEFLHGVVASFEAPHCLFQTDQSILIQIKIEEVFHRKELNQITSPLKARMMASSTDLVLLFCRGSIPDFGLHFSQRNGI